MKTILIVDDQAAIADALAELFAEEGVNTLLAADGLEALEVLREQRPDLVLTDVRMPRLGGEELCARIKGNPDLAGIRVVLMSGTEVHWTRYSPDAFIAKGSDLSYILNVVEGLLSGAPRGADPAGGP